MADIPPHVQEMARKAMAKDEATKEQLPVNHQESKNFENSSHPARIAEIQKLGQKDIKPPDKE